MNYFWIALGFILLAPLEGGLLTGLDRIISARFQGRVGPPLLQPFYDVLKLLQKESTIVTSSQNFYILGFLIFIIITGVLFFCGVDILLVIFVLTLASIFLVLGGYSTHSPYSYIGAERELLLMMSYEPMVLLTAIGIFMATGSFSLEDIISNPNPIHVIAFLPGVFIGFVYVLMIKFRKSPFDLSMSHHAHQEIVRGLTTEFTGKTLAMIEIAHWYENIFLLGVVYLFFAFNPILGLFMTLAVYFLSIVVDNVSARFKWQLVFKSTWLIAGVLGITNIVVLYVLKMGWK